MDKDADPDYCIHQLFRTAHTLKGPLYGQFQSIGDLTHHIEDFMGSCSRGTPEFRPGSHTDVLLRAIDVIRSLVRRDLSLLTRTRHQQFVTALQGLKRLLLGATGLHAGSTGGP